MRLIIFMAGLSMILGWGLTWIDPPFAGAALSPMALVADGRLVLGPGSAWQAWVFVGSFAAAGLAALMALGGRGAWFWALLAGLAPCLVLGEAVLRGAVLQAIDLGLPFAVDLADPREGFWLLQDFLRIGFWAYVAGAALLLIAGLLSALRGRR